MIRIRQLIQYKSFISNTFSLAISRGVDMVTQLLVMPKLISLFGIDNYGNIAFYTIILQYLTVFCDFGFNFNATKRVTSLNNVDDLSYIFTSVQIAKTLIMVVLNILLFFCFVLINNFDYKLYLAISIFVVLSSYNIDWLFLGKQQMIVPTILKLIVRFIYVFIIFFYFSPKSNCLYIVMLDCCIPIISIFSIIYAMCQYKIRLIKVSKVYIKEIFIESWVLFSSSLFIGFYRNINVLVLKLVAGEYYAGVYAAVEKISRACQSIIEPITTALFPFVSKKTDGNLHAKRNLINRLLFIYMIGLFLLMQLFIFFTDFILSFFKIEGEGALLNFYIMLSAFFFGCMNYLIGYVGLVNLNLNKQFRSSVFMVGLMAIPLSFVLSYFFKNIGAAISVGISEFVLFVFLFCHFKKYVKTIL